MKKYILVILVLFSSISFAQLKADADKQPNVMSGILAKDGSNSFLGLFNPANFSMHHSLEMSYANLGNGYMTLGVYTNSISYKFSDVLNFQMDASIINSPANSFGSDFTKQLNGIYITRALLNYKLSDDIKIFIEYRRMPMGLYISPYGYSGFGNSGLGYYGYGFNSFGEE